MKKYKNETVNPLLALTCDKCGKQANREEQAFYEFLSISHHSGYANTLGEEFLIEVDFCRDCAQHLLERYYRVNETDIHGDTFVTLKNPQTATINWAEKRAFVELPSDAISALNAQNITAINLHNTEHGILITPSSEKRDEK